MIHNGDAIVINMSHFVELFLDLCMLALWSMDINVSARVLVVPKRHSEGGMVDSLNTAWMETGLVDAIGIDHFGE